MTDAVASFRAIVYSTMEKVVDDMISSAAEQGIGVSADAFDYYVATHGLPSTPGAARRMFEFACILLGAADQAEEALNELLAEVAGDNRN